MSSKNVPTVEWAPPSSVRGGDKKGPEWISVTPLSVVKHLRLREIGGLPKFTNFRSEMGIIRLLVKSRAPVLSSTVTSVKVEEVQTEETATCSNALTNGSRHFCSKHNNKSNSDDEGNISEETEVRVNNNCRKPASSSSAAPETLVVTPVGIKTRNIGRCKGTHRKDSKYKYTFIRTRAPGEETIRKSVIFMFDDILIFNARGNKIEIHVAEFDGWLSKALTKRYAVWGEYKAHGKKNSLQDVKVDMMQAVQIKGNTVNQERYVLVVLSQSKIITYDLQSGKFMDMIDLKSIDGQEEFKCNKFSCFSDTFIGPCIYVERALNRGDGLEFLLLAPMPLSVKYRFKFHKGVLVGFNKGECLDGDLLFYTSFSRNKMSCLVDIRDIVKDNQETTTVSTSTNPQFEGMRIVEVRVKPDILVTIRMQLKSINCWANPPCALGNTVIGDLVVFNLAKPEQPIHLIESSIGEESILSTYSSISSEILLSGANHGFSIFELRNELIKTEDSRMDSIENILKCEEIFSTTSLFSAPNEELVNDSRKNSGRNLRPIQRKVYSSAGDSEKLYFFEYDCVLNLFVAIEIDISMKCVNIHLYDRETKKLVMKLKPFCLKNHMSVRTGTYICPVRSKIVLNFAYSYISLNITYISARGSQVSSYVYFVNLIGECVEKMC